MLLGYAKGKLGDIVFYRRNGVQCQRPRNREPNNPRTEKQMIQRAIMATVLRMYASGKELFDHSFQGKKVGADNQSEFMRLNLNLLRTAVSKDFTSNVDDASALARVVAPGAMSPVPFSYQLSNGSYAQNLFTVSVDTSSTPHVPQVELPEVESTETVAAYATRLGLIPGDIYTIVCVASSPSEVYYETPNIKLASTPRALFCFVRLTVKDDLTSTAALTTIGQLFDIESNVRTDVDGATPMGDTITPNMVSGINTLTEGAIGVIRSRDNEDLRSESYMVFSSSYGIIAPYISPVWQAGTSKIGQSSLILEGGNF